MRSLILLKNTNCAFGAALVGADTNQGYSLRWLVSAPTIREPIQIRTLNLNLVSFREVGLLSIGKVSVFLLSCL